MPIAVPPESIRNIIDKSRASAEEELMQSVEDTIVENAEELEFNDLRKVRFIAEYLVKRPTSLWRSSFDLLDYEIKSVQNSAYELRTKSKKF